MNNIFKYRSLCKEEKSIPLFLQAWWLDLVAQDIWDVVIVLKDDKILAALPFVIKNKMSFKYITQPPLTQYLGPWFKDTGAKYSKKLALQKENMNDLIDLLPKDHDFFQQNFDVSITNWLPFYWRGFNQSTRYTYRISKENNIDYWDNIQGNLRTDIKKAKNRFGIKIQKNNNIEEFLLLNEKTFLRKGMALPYTKNFLRNIITKSIVDKRGDVYLAIDEEGKSHAGAFIVRDEKTAYYIAGGTDPDLRNSGAASLCLWEALQDQLKLVNVFDFEGSMIEPIEKFFRAFGGIQTPYFQITKVNSLPLKIIINLKNIMRRC